MNCTALHYCSFCNSVHWTGLDCTAHYKRAKWNMVIQLPVWSLLNMTGTSSIFPHETWRLFWFQTFSFSRQPVTFCSSFPGQLYIEVYTLQYGARHWCAIFSISGNKIRFHSFMQNYKCPIYLIGTPSWGHRDTDGNPVLHFMAIYVTSDNSHNQFNNDYRLAPSQLATSAI